MDNNIKNLAGKFKKAGSVPQEQPLFTPVATKDVYLKRDEFTATVEHFINTQPGFVLKGPIYIIFLLMFAALIYSFFAIVIIKVTTNVSVSGVEYQIQNPVLGTVSSIMVEENDEVKDEQVLLALVSNDVLMTESGANELKESLEDIKTKYSELTYALQQINSMSDFYGKKDSRLRVSLAPEIYLIQQELLNDSSQSLVSSENWRRTDLYNFVEKTRLSLSEMYSDLLVTSKLLEKQKKIFNEDEKLFHKDVITEYQYASSQQSYLNMESQLSNQLNNFKILIHSSAENLRQQRDLIVSQHKEMMSELNQNLINDENIIVDDKLVLIKSKYPGIVADIAVDSYQLISRGMPVITIIRDDLPKYGVLYISDSNIGKVKNGQNVTIKFDAYPFQEYGVQTGAIVSISTDPKIIEGAGLVYEARMAFDNLNPKINLKFGMHGLAEIETGEKRLIETVFAPVTKVFDYLHGSDSDSD